MCWRHRWSYRVTWPDRMLFVSHGLWLGRRSRERLWYHAERTCARCGKRESYPLTAREVEQDGLGLTISAPDLAWSDCLLLKHMPVRTYWRRGAQGWARVRDPRQHVHGHHMCGKIKVYGQVRGDDG